MAYERVKRTYLTTLYGEALCEKNSDLVRWLRKIRNTDTGYVTVFFFRGDRARRAYLIKERMER